MATLLTKLRIDYTSLTMLTDVNSRPQQHTINFHLKLLQEFREGSDSKCFVSDTELVTLEKKTHRQLRLRELLLEHSKETTLVVMSLPMPREVLELLKSIVCSVMSLFFQKTVSAPLYMSWLEVLTKDIPPILLIRGNQSSVLTFYS